MPQATARRSFHGPFLHPSSSSLARQRQAKDASLGRALIRAARGEAPSDGDRARVLAGVLAALQLLTCANAAGAKR